ncbi:MAG: aldo/keto reductase [Planctomycetes bacterium]|nr:aldo/keto reductase [Planctomycetota bacterium]
MDTRTFGRTGWQVSEIGFGAWGIGGGAWGGADDAESMAALHAALDAGITFFDTADVYGDGRSERLISRLRRERSEPFRVATKAGRRLAPHTAAGYTAGNIAAFVDRSLTNLAVERIDLLQLHCPPTEVYYRPEVFSALDDLVTAGKIAFYGVSVEKVEEALKAIEYPNVQSVQIIFNAFRLRPTELFFEQALRRRVAVIARVPLASGMLSGCLTRDTTFPDDDHRTFNREGAAFDKGETFSGVPYDAALAAVERLKPFVPPGSTLAQFALRWILAFEAVTCVIPGARGAARVIENAKAADLPPPAPETMEAVQEVYDSLVRPLVHHRW